MCHVGYYPRIGLKDPDLVRILEEKKKFVE